MATPTNPPASSSTPADSPAATTTPATPATPAVTPAAPTATSTAPASPPPEETTTSGGDVEAIDRRTWLEPLMERTPGEPIALDDLDVPFTSDMLDELAAAGSPYYQMASNITRSLAELEIVAAHGNLTRVQAVMKELEEYAHQWNRRDDLAEGDRSRPPIGRSTRQQRQIRTGEPMGTMPARTTAAAGTTATSAGETTTPATTARKPAAAPPTPPTPPPPPPARPASSSGAT